MSLEKKKEALIENLKTLKRVVVAYSGGVDSTLLLKMAIDTLGKSNVIAIIAQSPTYPEREKIEAINFCKEEGVTYLLIQSDEMEDEKFVANDAKRCYYCKRHLYEEAKKISKKYDIEHIIEGSNWDDLYDYRPGRKAIEEMGIKSPLLEAKLTKEEIRVLSKNLGLKTYSKPSKACLASRVPYGTTITESILKMVEKAEEAIEKYDIRQTRVRYHNNIARIEVFAEDFEKIISNREAIVKDLKGLGFHYVTLDLLGYRTGSMNEIL